MTTNRATYRDDPNHLFTLRVPVSKWVPPKPGQTIGSTVKTLVTIHAFDGGFQAPNHNRIDVEVRMGGKTVFPRGATYCGLTQGFSVDGIHAKELVLSLIAMKPGDTDNEYFASYTPEQIEFAETFGEDLNMYRLDRCCDPETGEPRSEAS